MCIFSSEALDCKNGALYRQTNTVPLFLYCDLLFYVRTKSELLLLDKVTMNLFKTKRASNI